LSDRKCTPRSPRTKGEGWAETGPMAASGADMAPTEEMVIRGDPLRGGGVNAPVVRDYNAKGVAFRCEMNKA
jgi:hypothetical protein